jgi:hypothetical protein
VIHVFKREGFNERIKSKKKLNSKKNKTKKKMLFGSEKDSHIVENGICCVIKEALGPRFIEKKR